LNEEGGYEPMMLPTRRCECGAADCETLIRISHEEQDTVDHDPRNLWIVAPGHSLRGARKATVVAERPGYSVVETEEDR
jgi:hypothetical protein